MDFKTLLPFVLLTVSAMGILALVGGSLGFWHDERRMAAEAKRRAEATIENRLAQLGATMQAASLQLEEVAAEITARAAAVAKLKSDADEAERLVQLTQEQRDAVVRMMRAELHAEGKQAQRKDFRRDLLFFVTGALLSLTITLFVHPL